jgi:hypothetical protein
VGGGEDVCVHGKVLCIFEGDRERIGVCLRPHLPSPPNATSQLHQLALRLRRTNEMGGLEGGGGVMGPRPKPVPFPRVPVSASSVVVVVVCLLSSLFWHACHCHLPEPGPDSDSSALHHSTTILLYLLCTCTVHRRGRLD